MLWNTPFSIAALTPFRGVRSLEDLLESELGRAFAPVALAAGARAAGSAAGPVLDLWEDEEGLLLRAELPGVDPASLDLSIADQVLTLRGERAAGPEAADANGAKGATWHRRERASGAFARSIELPCRVDAAAVTATSRNGVLEVRLPRPAQERLRKIPVQTR